MNTHEDHPALDVESQPEPIEEPPLPTPLPMEHTNTATTITTTNTKLERRNPTPTPDGLLATGRDYTDDVRQDMRRAANDPDYLQMRFAATGGITLPAGTALALLPAPPPMLHPAAMPIAGGAAAAAVAGGSYIPLQQPVPAPQAAVPDMNEVWQCYKCKRDNLAVKARCGSCQSWKGGKRQSYSKTKASAQQTNMMPPQVPWTCPCGNANSIKKVRCTKCQKWKGGRRHPKGALAAKWYAEQQQLMMYGNNQTEVAPEPTEPWKCDKCGNENAPKKVRCMACPRWKNGKRPKYGKNAAAATAMAMTKHTVAPFPAMPTTAAVVGMIGQRGGMMGHSMTEGEIEKFESMRGNWFCGGCNHLNEAKKARCGSCQRWKFGKRDNMLKKNRPAPPAPPANIETTGGGSSNSNPMVTGELSTHQHQQVLAGADPAAANMVVPGLQHLQQHLQMAKWLCPCGQINFPEKTRCTSCSKWKGGKRGNVPRKATKDPETEQIVAALSKKPPARLAVLPNQPNMPWKCTRCGNDNDMRKLRCGTCQSWKNGKKQLSQRAEMQSLPHATPALDKLLAAPPADGALHRSHWKCHNCHAEVLSTKHRCPSCKSWKGGVRDMGAKKKPSFWTCVCKRQNEEKKARCGGCMRWRGGKRPEALHQQDKVHNGSWVCERCSRPNKKSKVRCGGCQRWRDGMRPDMRKGARAARAAATGPNGPQQFQMLSVKHAPQLPPFHIPQMTLVTGSVAGPVAQPGAQPVPQHPTLLVQVPINPINTIDAARAIQHNLAVQNQAIPVALPAATADRDKTGVAWTCQKCTCDNLATELACKICDSPRESWV